MSFKTAVCAGLALLALVGAGSASAATSGTLTATLAGAPEIPGPGDPDGRGSARLQLDATTGEVCYRLAVRGITLPAAAAHIHVGASGVAGAILVPLGAPDASGAANGCATGVASATVQAILDDPSAYYVNVHTSDFPAGALRGQLRRGPITFTLVERESEGDDFGFVDNPPRGGADERPSIGDLFGFTTSLFTQARGGQRAGTLSATCVAVLRRPVRFQCDAVARLEGGTLSLATVIVGEPRRIFAAITGGTGIYAGATGTFVSTETPRVSYDRFTVFLP